MKKQSVSKAAIVATAIFALATGSAWAATDTTWNGGTGGTEAAPINYYDSTKWSSGKLPSDAYNLKFSVDAPLVITNTASASTYVADHICFNKGQYTVLGPAKFNGFHEGASESGTVSITKKGDWTTHWYFYPCNTSGSEVVVTNKTGNWIIGGSASDVGMRAPYVASSTFRFVIESGTITLKKTSSIGYKGTGYLELNGGKIQSDSYLNIGSAGTGYMTINGGEFVGASTLKRLAYDTGSKGTLTMNGGKATFSGGDLEIGRKGAGNVIMNGGTLTVNSGTWVYMGRETGSSGNITLNGGTFTAKHIHKGGNGGTITFDGGTLKANASYGDNGGIIQNDTGIKVVVAAKGGTIDTGGYNVTYGKNTTTKEGVANDGGLMFKGGGSVTVNGDANNPRLTYNGRTTVEVGTLLKVPTATIGGGFAATIPSGLADGLYMVAMITGDDAFPADILDNAELPADPKAGFALSSDRRIIWCAYGDTGADAIWLGGNGNFSDSNNWLGGTVPSGTQNIVINGYGYNIYVTNNIPGLSPATISINGDGRVYLYGEGFSGVEKVVNNSSAAARDYIYAPVAFKSDVTLSGNMSVEFGNASGQSIVFSDATSYAQSELDGNITLSGDWTPDRALSIQDGTLTVEGTLGGWGKLAIKASGSLKTGSISYTSATQNAVAFTELSGFLEVDSISVVNSEDMFPATTGGGTVKVRQVIADTKQNVRLNANGTDLTWIIGEGGISYGSTATAYSGVNVNCIYIIGNGRTVTMKPMADWSWEGSPIDGQLFLSGSSKGSLVLDTTDAYDSSRARTVTLNGFVRQGVNMTVKGIGTVVLNHAEPFQIDTLNTVVSVEDAATLRLNPVCTTLAAAVTMANGTALALPLDSNGDVVTHSVSNFTQAADAGVRFVIDGDTLADGEYTLITATHSMTADPSKILIVGTAVAGKVATASVDGKSLKMTVSAEYTGPDSIWTGVKDSNLLDPDNWLGGVPTAENGRAAIIGVAEPATFVCPQGFSPVSITFPAGSAKVTIEGEGEISGIVAITNLSNASHEFKVPVSGGTVDLVNVSMYCTFTGGFTVENPVFTNSPERNLARGIAGNWTVTGEGFVTVPYMKIYSGVFHVTAPMGSEALGNLLVAEGATFRAAKATLPANGYVESNYILIGYRNGGTVIFDELVAESATEMKKLAFSQESTGIIRIGKFTNNAKQHVRLNDLTFVMGEGGLCYGPDSSNGTTDWYSTDVNAGTDATIWPSADYTIGLNGNDSRDPKSSSNERRDFGIGYTNSGADSSVLTLYTSDYDDNSVPRKVTIDGVIYSNVSGGYGLAGKMWVRGCGEVLFNSYSRFGMGITVEDTATLSVNAGCAPGIGIVTMNSGTTLSLPETGSVTLGGTLTLAAGTKLGFTIDGADNSVLAVPSLTLNATSADPVTVTVDALSMMVPGKAYTLLSGGGLAAADLDKFQLAEGDKGTLSVSGGDLVYTASEYFYIRIAESGSGELNVPFQWMFDAGIASLSSSAEEIAAALVAGGDNGIPVWQSYCLGLDPHDASSVVFCIPASEQPSAAGEFKFTTNVAVPEGMEGVAVTASIERKTTGEWTRQGAPCAVEYGVPVELTASADSGNAMSFFA